jgi:hypothetical protein
MRLATTFFPGQFLWKAHGRLPALLYAGAWFALMVGVGILGGMLAWWMHKPSEVVQWLHEGPYFAFDFSCGPWKSIVHGVIYSASMFSSLLLAMRYARRRFPLHTWRQATAHVLLLSTFSGAAFAAANVLCELLPNAHNDPGPSLLMVASIAFPFSFIFSIGCYFFDFNRRLRQAEHAALAAELKALRAQINPHFLFNALNTIAALVRRQPQVAEEVTEELADLFRYVLRASEKTVVTLREELECARMYLAIEEARFGNRLAVEIDVAQELCDVRVPSLLLQPLVENAIKHGVSQSEKPCVVQVRARLCDGQVEIAVFDTGPGFVCTDIDIVCRRGTGLGNVFQRLQLLFGTRARMMLSDRGVTLVFPNTALAQAVPATAFSVN